MDDEQEFADKRFEGRASYAYLRGMFSHEESWANDAQMTVRGGWQLASRPLVSNEQFVIGGVHTVRGYLEAAALGDDGFNLTLEARTPNYAKHLSDSLDDLRLLAFVDGGYVSIQQPLPAQEARFFPGRHRHRLALQRLERRVRRAGLGGGAEGSGRGRTRRQPGVFPVGVCVVNR